MRAEAVAVEAGPGVDVLLHLYRIRDREGEALVGLTEVQMARLREARPDTDPARDPVPALRAVRHLVAWECRHQDDRLALYQPRVIVSPQSPDLPSFVAAQSDPG